MKKFILLITVLLLINGCKKKDDNPISEENNIENGGDVYTSKLIVLNNENVIENEYEAMFGTVPIVLYKTDENELMFKVPDNMELGVQLLSVPMMNEYKINYNVKETILSGTADETLEDYFSNVNTYLTSIDGSETSVYINSYFQKFNEVYDNASEAEKNSVARFYKANRTIFDNVLIDDFSTKTIDGTDMEILLKWAAATVAFGVSAAIAILDPEGLSKAIAVGLAYISWNKALELKREFASRNVKKLNVLIDGIASLLDTRSVHDDTLELTSGVTSNFTLESKKRPIISSDTNDENSNISTFFDKFDFYTSTIERINIAIQYINDNVFFSDIDLIPIEIINETNPIEVALENEEFYNKINFSIQDSNVNIDNISFSEGNLSITASIVDDTDVDEYIDTTINYTYENEFNLITGRFPIRILKENNPLSGTWYINDTGVFSCYSRGIVFNSDHTITFTGTVGTGAPYDCGGDTIPENYYTFDGTSLIIHTVSVFDMDPCPDDSTNPNVIFTVNVTMNLSYTDSESFSGNMSYADYYSSGCPCAGEGGCEGWSDSASAVLIRY